MSELPSRVEVDAEVAYRRSRLCVGYRTVAGARLIAPRDVPEPAAAESIERTPSVWRALLRPGV